MDIAAKLKELEPDSAEYIKLLSEHLSDTRAKKRRLDNKRKLGDKKGTKDSCKKAKTDDVNVGPSTTVNRNDGIINTSSSEPTQSQAQLKGGDEVCLTDTSDDDADDERTSQGSDKRPIETGVCLHTTDEFCAEKLALINTSKGFTLAYNSDNRFFLRSGEFVGQITGYDSKFSTSLLVKKGELLELVRSQAEKLLGKNKKLMFYGKADSCCASFFPESILNGARVKCLNVLRDGTPELITLEELTKLSGHFTMVLKSGKIVKKTDQEYIWRMTIAEGELNPLPKGYEGYFRALDSPKLMFFNKNKGNQ